MGRCAGRRTLGSGTPGDEQPCVLWTAPGLRQLEGKPENS
jgi:hypothetical protein